MLLNESYDCADCVVNCYPSTPFQLAFITLQNSFQYADNVRFVIGTLSVAMVPVRASPDAEGSDFSDMFGEGTIQRPWDDGTESVENAKRRLRVAFEFIKR